MTDEPKLPWLVEGLPEPQEEPSGPVEPPPRPSFARDVLPDVLASLGVLESADPGTEATLAAFRKRYGIGPDVPLTTELIDAALRARAQERERRINEFLGGA